jgi:uncharacterized Zn-finger protein
MVKVMSGAGQAGEVAAAVRGAPVSSHISVAHNTEPALRVDTPIRPRIMHLSPKPSGAKMAFAAQTPTPKIGTVETILVESRVVACDGGDGPLGHPRVWLRIEQQQIFCPYCSRLFVLKPGAGHDEH